MRVVNVATGKWLMATMITQDWLSKAPVSVLVLYIIIIKKEKMSSA